MGPSPHYSLFFPIFYVIINLWICHLHCPIRRFHYISYVVYSFFIDLLVASSNSSHLKLDYQLVSLFIVRAYSLQPSATKLILVLAVIEAEQP